MHLYLHDDTSGTTSLTTSPGRRESGSVSPGPMILFAPELGHPTNDLEEPRTISCRVSNLSRASTTTTSPALPGATEPPAARRTCPYDRAATEYLREFEKICARNSHVLYTLDATHEAAAITVDTLPQRAGMAPPRSEPATIFQSVQLPSMRLPEFADILRRHARCERSTVAAAVVLAWRYCDRSQVKPTLHMMHRLFAVSLQVATKALHEFPRTNAHAARATGITNAEMNRLEAHFVVGCDWQLVVFDADIRHVAATAMEMRSSLAMRTEINFVDSMESALSPPFLARSNSAAQSADTSMPFGQSPASLTRARGSQADLLWLPTAMAAAAPAHDS